MGNKGIISGGAARGYFKGMADGTVEDTQINPMQDKVLAGEIQPPRARTPGALTAEEESGKDKIKAGKALKKEGRKQKRSERKAKIEEKKSERKSERKSKRSDRLQKKIDLQEFKGKQKLASGDEVGAKYKKDRIANLKKRQGK